MTVGEVVRCMQKWQGRTRTRCRGDHAAIGEACRSTGLAAGKGCSQEQETGLAGEPSCRSPGEGNSAEEWCTVQAWCKLHGKGREQGVLGCFAGLSVGLLHVRTGSCERWCRHMQMGQARSLRQLKEKCIVGLC